MKPNEVVSLDHILFFQKLVSSHVLGLFLISQLMNVSFFVAHTAVYCVFSFVKITCVQVILFVMEQNVLLMHMYTVWL